MKTRPPKGTPSRITYAETVALCEKAAVRNRQREQKKKKKKKKLEELAEKKKREEEEGGMSDEV